MKVFAILGDRRIAHSLSPRMHNKVLQNYGVKGYYVPCRVEPGDLAQAMAGLAALNLDGANVTVPHKEAVMPFLSGLSPEAQAVGAVNTLVRADGAFWGDNTDVGGFADLLAQADCNPQGKQVVVFGAGGAARAVVLALRRQGAKVQVASRKVERAELLTRDLGGRAVSLEAGLQEASQAELLVNATSVSSPQEAPGLAKRLATLGGLKNLRLLVDINYGRPDNFWEKLTQKNQAEYLDGLFMLAAQARRSFSLWTGLNPSLGEFVEALRD